MPPKRPDKDQKCRQRDLIRELGSKLSPKRPKLQQQRATRKRDLVSSKSASKETFCAVKCRKRDLIEVLGSELLTSAYYPHKQKRDLISSKVPQKKEYLSHSRGSGGGPVGKAGRGASVGVARCAKSKVVLAVICIVYWNQICCVIVSCVL